MGKICGAKTRSGKPCQKPPAKGRNRCRLHGGASPRGKDSARYRHGTYSTEVKDRIARLRALAKAFASGEVDTGDAIDEINAEFAARHADLLMEFATANPHDTENKKHLQRAIESSAVNFRQAARLKLEKDSIDGDKEAQEGHEVRIRIERPRPRIQPERATERAADE
jgi:hypothetical protein